jgi:hypothetical protein
MPFQKPEIANRDIVQEMRRFVKAGINSGFEPHIGMDEIKAEGRQRLINGKRSSHPSLSDIGISTK